MPTVLERTHDPVAANGRGSSLSELVRSDPWSPPAAAARASVSNDTDRRDDLSPSAMHEYQPLFDVLTQAIQRRWAMERELAQRFPSGSDEREQHLQSALRELSERREQQLETLRDEFARRREELTARANSNLQVVDYSHREALRQIERAHNDEASALEARYHDSTWVTSSVLDDTSEDSPKRRFEKFHTQLQKLREDQQATYGELEVAFQTLQEITGWEGSPPLEPENRPKDREGAQERFRVAVELARQKLADVEGQWLRQLFVGWRALMFFVVLAGLMFLPLFLAVPPAMLGLRFEPWSESWAGVAAGAACGVALLIELIVYSVASMRQSDALQQVQQNVAEAGWAHQLWLGMARDELQTKTREFEARQREVVRQREASLQRYQAAHADQRQEIEVRRDAAIQQEVARATEQRRQIETRQQQEEESLDREQRDRMAELSRRFESEYRQLEHELGGHTATRQRSHAQLWHALRTDWEAAQEEFRSSVVAVQEAVRSVFPNWTNLLTEWRPPTDIPTAVRLGEYQIDLREIPHAIPADPRIAPPETAFELPALLRFPSDSSVLLKFKGAAGRSAAVQLQQTLLLRLLTQVPPGKLRLTILDPVGLGESFAGFMHLADFDERLVTSRIWTEPGQIEARLADLTEHMENVFQKYLRNEFATLEDYNVHAGEVAEPYHFLVISDFPSKFSDVATRRLTSILASGPRCGVYTLLSADLAQPLPAGFNLQDVQEQVRTLTWRDGAYRAGDVDHRPTSRAVPSPLVSDELTLGFEMSEEEPGPMVLPDWPLVIDPPPPPELFTALVKMVGRESKDARRVEVAFSRIAPRTDQWWTQDSRREIDVPLGRAGATRLQHLLLGRGTSQHMLVAGKTGSGKSTFLHTLITNVALHYSPEEVRFYLVDFKKGVEFKDYAACEFPHADVIAIESDREFGVSVLQRLDAVLQERGELFRRQGVQDIAGYRNAHPTHKLPRILLVVDEFQEFFIEDDKLSQTASLLLDRLVRQGRAFGMHVILGSQTLGGAYSLARSTLGQVAVRVALQCSEADAHLILSESNTAARLLTRPGEAIYNDANGLLEGNHPFQIAWLPDGEREACLRRLADLARDRGLEIRPPIVFEGNVASDPSRNRDLVTLLTAAYETQHTSVATTTTSAAKPRTPTVWLGDAVEISAPASITFPRQAGQNLLIVGADSEAAYGVLATVVVSLAGQFAGRGTTAAATGVYLFDGSAPDSVESDGWRQLCEATPSPVRRVLPRDAATVLKELTAEMQRREREQDSELAPLFVVVHHLARFRDLRKAEDDYGFGGFGSQAAEKPVEPGKLFADLVSRGPDVGIHLLIWCDSAGNVERWMSRNTLGEFELRIAFQMNAADSSNLIDTPAAAKLGVHRALLYREESGTSEKFRPYGAPALAWLRELKTPSQATESTAAVPPSASSPPPAIPSETQVASASEEPEVATDLDAFTVL